MNDERIRKRLIWLREQRDWTQKQLAERILSLVLLHIPDMMMQFIPKISILI